MKRNSWKVFTGVLPCLLLCAALSGCASVPADHILPSGEPISTEAQETGEAAPPTASGDDIVGSAPAIHPGIDTSGENTMPQSPIPEETVSLPCPGVQTLENFLKMALLPLGNTMYVWGGGWNEEDTGAGEEAKRLGVSPAWAAFAAQQTASYDYKDTRYQIHDGLDCSGYVGWVVYNTLCTEDGLEGYVFKSTETALKYASFGWGSYTDSILVQNWLPGDILSMKGHVWICLTSFEDGSVLLTHSSPPGVRLCGTSPDGNPTMATLVAEYLMEAEYPDWYLRYPDCTVDTGYLNASSMRWSSAFFPDAEEIRSLNSRELLTLLFPDADIAALIE